MAPHPAGRRNEKARLREDGPYFWVTWLTRLLSREDSCEWAAWFRAHHESGSWQPAPGNFDRVGWQMDHTAAVTAAQDRWEGQGHMVYTEKQNSFALKGASGTLGGRPDLIARLGDSGTIIDVKTGNEHQHLAHVVQVMLYMYAVPRCIAEHRGVAFSGQVAYPAGAVEIPAEAVDEEFVRRVSPPAAEAGGRPTSPEVPQSPWSAPTAPSLRPTVPERMTGGGLQEGTTSDF